MIALFLIYIGLAAIIPGAIFLRFRFGYTTRDFAVLLFFLFPVLFLRRWLIVGWFTFLGRIHMGFLIGMLLGWLFLFLALTVVSRRHTNFRMPLLGLLIGLLVVVGIISGVFNDSSKVGIGAPLQAASQWVLPALLAFIVIRSLPDTLEANARLRISYVIAFGYLVSILSIACSVFSRQLAPIFGWQEIGEGPAGFVRGWTPLGGAIVSGTTVSFACAFCLAEVLRRRHIVFHLFGAILCAIAILFTLSRGAMLIFIMVNVLVLRGLIVRYSHTVFIGFLAFLLIFLPIFWVLSRRYEWGRFITIAGPSIAIRTSSARAALSMVAVNPVLGTGPGLIYEEVRRPGWKRRGPMVLGNYYTAGESHSAYLLTLVETGIIGLFLLMLLFAYLYRRFSTGRKLCSFIPVEMPIANIYWAIMVVIILYSLFAASEWIYVKPAMVRWITIFVGLHHVSSLESEVQHNTLSDIDLEYSQENHSYA